MPLQVFAGIKEAVFGGQLQGVTEGAHAPGHDRNLGHLAAAGHQVANDGVAHLVVSHHSLFVVLQYPAAFLEAGHHPFDRFV